MKVLFPQCTIFSVIIVLFVMINCSKDSNNKEIINLGRCGAYPKCDTTYDSSHGVFSVHCDPTGQNFALPCYKDSTDTIQFRFMIPAKTVVSLELVDENENVKQLL